MAVSGAMVWLLGRVNAARVTREELRAAGGALRDSAAAGPESVGMLLAQMHPGEPDKALAIKLRLDALASLYGSTDPARWSLPVLPDATAPVPDAVFAAAAEEPLVLLRGQVRFDGAAFIRRLFGPA